MKYKIGDTVQLEVTITGCMEIIDKETEEVDYTYDVIFTDFGGFDDSVLDVPECKLHKVF